MSEPVAEYLMIDPALLIILEFLESITDEGAGDIAIGFGLIAIG